MGKALLLMALIALSGCAPMGDWRRTAAFERDLDRCAAWHDPGRGEDWAEARVGLFSGGFLLGEPGWFMQDCMHRRGWHWARLL